MLNFVYTLDQRIIRLARSIGPTALRIALAIVFIWFGALKVLRVSPVAELVAQLSPLRADLVESWCPWTLLEPQRFRSTDLSVFSFGMAHKIRVPLYHRLRELLDATDAGGVPSTDSEAEARCHSYRSSSATSSGSECPFVAHIDDLTNSAFEFSARRVYCEPQVLRPKPITFAG